MTEDKLDELAAELDSEIKQGRISERLALKVMARAEAGPTEGGPVEPVSIVERLKPKKTSYKQLGLVAAIGFVAGSLLDLF